MCFLHDLWIICAASSLSMILFLPDPSVSAVPIRSGPAPAADKPPTVVGGGGLGMSGFSNIARHHSWISTAQNSVYVISLHDGPCSLITCSQYSLYLFFVFGKALAGRGGPCVNQTVIIVISKALQVLKKTIYSLITMAQYIFHDYNIVILILLFCISYINFKLLLGPSFCPSRLLSKIGNQVSIIT